MKNLRINLIEYIFENFELVVAINLYNKASVYVFVLEDYKVRRNTRNKN